MSNDPILMESEYQVLRGNLAFKKFLRKLATDRVVAYKALRGCEDPQARAALSIYDSIFSYLALEVQHTEKEAEQKRKRKGS